MKGLKIFMTFIAIMSMFFGGMLLVLIEELSMAARIAGGLIGIGNALAVFASMVTFSNDWYKSALELQEQRNKFRDANMELRNKLRKIGEHEALKLLEEENET